MFILLPQDAHSLLVSEEHIVAMWEDERSSRTVILTDCGERLWTSATLADVQEISMSSKADDVRGDREARALPVTHQRASKRIG